MTKKVKRVKERMNSFSARGSICPICKKPFRHGCNHSVEQAKDRLFQNYVKAIVNA